MLTFLFWNLRKQNLARSIARLVNLYAIDIVILAETNSVTTAPGVILNTLKIFHYSPDDQCPRIQIFTRFPATTLLPIHSHSRYTVRAFNLTDGTELLLVAAHLISLLNTTEVSQNEEARRMAQTIRDLEKERGHRQTVLVGDLNLNPFAEAIVSAHGLHGVMTKQIARKGERTIYSEPYPFFYNPMWSKFGDKEPPGTYYYDNSGHVCYFWNLFDQVLIRPDLLKLWEDSDLMIPVSDGEDSLLTGRYNTLGGKGKSDHLPLLFRLRL